MWYKQYSAHAWLQVRSCVESCLLSYLNVRINLVIAEWYNNYWTRLLQNVVIRQCLADQLYTFAFTLLGDWPAGWPADRPNDQLNNGLVDRPTYQTNWATGVLHWLTDWPTDWQTEWPDNWLTILACFLLHVVLVVPLLPFRRASLKYFQLRILVKQRSKKMLRSCHGKFQSLLPVH